MAVAATSGIRDIRHLNDWRQRHSQSASGVGGAERGGGGPRARRSIDIPLLPPSVRRRIFSYLDLGSQSRLQRVSREWRAMLSEEIYAETSPVWMYIVFRKGRKGGHDKPTVNVSFDGPIFWGKRVIYVYACSCHYAEKHEGPLLGLCERVKHRVERICLVDSPVNYPFMTDNFFHFCVQFMPQLEFLYLRELDLESLNFATVQKMATHPSLKKVIVHMCRKFDVLQDFGPLPQLLVVKGEIQGLKAFIGDIEWEEADETTESVSEAASIPKSSAAGEITERLQNGAADIHNGDATPSSSKSADHSLAD